MSAPLPPSRADNDTAHGVEKEILIVDADLRVCETVWESVRAAGLRSCIAPTAQQAARHIASRRPHALIVDWSLPDRSGLSFLVDLRAQPRTRHLPTIMLSAHGNEDDCVRALEAGADDYVHKPFSSPELISRLRVLLRPTPRRQASARIAVRGLTLDVDESRVRSSADRGETMLQLNPFECRLLHFFLTRTQRVYGRREIIRELWGPQAELDVRSVDLHVFHLRRALRALGFDTLIETVRGRGYRLSDKIDTPQASADASHCPADAADSRNSAAVAAKPAPVAARGALSSDAGATRPASAAR